MICKKTTLIIITLTLFSKTLLIATGPSLQFSNGTNTGISSPIADTLAFGANGEERMNIDDTDVTVTATLVAAAPLYLTNLFCRQAVQIHPANESTSSVTVNPGISVLFIDDTASINRTVNVTLPPNPIDGQLLTIMSNKNSTNRYITLNYSAGVGGANVNTATSITRLSSRINPTARLYGASVTYIYLAQPINAWQKFRRG